MKQKTSSRSGFVPILIIVAIAIVIAGGAYVFMKNSTQLNSQPSNQTLLPKLITRENGSTYVDTSDYNLDTFISLLCNKQLIPIHVTEGRFVADDSKKQFFVQCEVPPHIPLPSWYIIEQGNSGFQIAWSKTLADEDQIYLSGPKLIDVDHDGFTEVFWSDSPQHGGTCAPFTYASHLFTGKYQEEFNIEKYYEFDSSCSSATLKSSKFSPDPSSRNSVYAQPFYDYLSNNSQKYSGS